jgi:RNA polymerase sigma-70 factor, ECF subfamily
VQNTIRDILNGNSESFRVIVQQFSDDLLRIAYHFVHDWDDAQDLTQNSLIRCYQNLRKYDPERPFRPWLYRIHVNICKAAARRKRGRLFHEIRFSPAEHDVGSEMTLDESAVIFKQIERLPVKQKAAFILIEMEGMTSREAAYVLGCADSTLRVHLARAKQSLRENLTRLGIGYGSVE